jgi:hypothetical protein
MSIAVHSWATSGHASIVPMQWCGVGHRTPLGAPESNAEQAARIAAADPTPYLFAIDDLQSAGHSVFDQDLETVLANGFDLTYYATQYADLFGTMHDEGIVPAKVIFDCELPGTWAYFNQMSALDNNQRTALMQARYDDAAIFARMTPAMKALTAEDFRAQAQNLQTYSEWFNEVTILSALRSIRDLARTAFGLPNLVATNYGDSSAQSFTALDLNGYPIAQAGVTSGWSAPTLYPELGRVTEGLSKHTLYNTYLNHLNTERSQDMTQTTIWMPFATQRVGFSVIDSFARWIWEQFVRLTIEAGATDLISFNPKPACPQTDDDLLAKILSDYAGHSFTPISGQAKVDLDSPSITMGTRSLGYPTFEGRLGAAVLRKKKHGKHQ